MYPYHHIQRGQGCSGLPKAFSYLASHPVSVNSPGIKAFGYDHSQARMSQFIGPAHYLKITRTHRASVIQHCFKFGSLQQPEAARKSGSACQKQF